jgi:hypothetical protein
MPTPEEILNSQDYFDCEYFRCRMAKRQCLVNQERGREHGNSHYQVCVSCPEGLVIYAENPGLLKKDEVHNRDYRGFTLKTGEQKRGGRPLGRKSFKGRPPKQNSMNRKAISLGGPARELHLKEVPFMWTEGEEVVAISPTDQEEPLKETKSDSTLPYCKTCGLKPATIDARGRNTGRCEDCHKAKAKHMQDQQKPGCRIYLYLGDLPELYDFIEKEALENERTVIQQTRFMLKKAMQNA